ncbi:unnamed protein product [Lampetra planeri]
MTRNIAAAAVRGELCGQSFSKIPHSYDESHGTSAEGSSRIRNHFSNPGPRAHSGARPAESARWRRAGISDGGVLSPLVPHRDFCHGHGEERGTGGGEVPFQMCSVVNDDAEVELQMYRGETREAKRFETPRCVQEGGSITSTIGRLPSHGGGWRLRLHAQRSDHTPLKPQQQQRRRLGPNIGSPCERGLVGRAETYAARAIRPGQPVDEGSAASEPRAKCVDCVTPFVIGDAPQMRISQSYS